MKMEMNQKSRSRILEKRNVNISAGGSFYECAKSRRTRHRDVLKNIDSYRAVPLGRGGARGPGLSSEFSSSGEPEFIPKKVFRIQNKEAVAKALKQRKISQMESYKWLSKPTESNSDTKTILGQSTKCDSKKQIMKKPSKDKKYKLERCNIISCSIPRKIIGDGSENNPILL